ncbi:MAG: protein kinase [Verrucomicrobia bacterium]|nr:protein kinase [Verrucomicrobiota bacterium]
MNDSQPNPCPRCGHLLAADTPGGLCPRCVMAMNLAPETILTQPDDPAPGLQPLSPGEIADKFPGYEILECLGRGGMGVVYKARQKSLDRIVAIKILPPERVGEERFADRFATEAATLAKLNHPNIVTVHDFGETGGLFYIVMEYVDGVNLRDLLREGKLEPQQALAIVPPVCDALQSAHEKGIVHRDIKPENILLDKDGRIKIADFGIAKLIGPVAAVCDRRTSPDESQRRSQTAATVMAGTQGYSAPEQANCTADHRADIYALGVVLYEMLTGERPNKDVVAPSRKVRIDVRLDEMVLRALEKEPERRYQTAGEFRTMVETIANAPVSGGSPASLLKSTECLYATPEFHQTIWGAMKIHQGLGSLFLYQDRLEVQAGLSRTTIPLENVRRLELIRYPFFQSPAGLRSIEIEFEDGNRLQRLVLTPSKGMFSFVGTTNKRVLEWFGSIREAIVASTGNAPPGSNVPLLYQGFSGEGTLVASCVMLGSFAVLLAVPTFLALTASWRSILPMAIPLVFGASFALALAWGQRRQRRKEPGSEAAGRPASVLVWSIALHGLVLLALALAAFMLLPSYGEIFSEFATPLPAATQWVFAIGRFVRGGGWLLFPVVFAVDGLICLLLFKRPSRKAFTIWVIAAMTAGIGFAALCFAAIQIPLRSLVDHSMPPGPALGASGPAPSTANDRILIEDLALHLIVAIRDKDDAKLKSLASDRIKGWPEALPVFAVELREHMRQATGNDKFDLRAGESLVDGDFAAVRCTGPAELDDKCLVLFFVKSADGWRSFSLCNATTATPLARILADLNKKSATKK